MLAAYSLSCTAQQGPRVCEYPFYKFTNATHTDVTKVELQDTATFVTLRTRYRPHNWVLWAKETAIVADGESYSIKGGQGMTPGEYIWMNDAGDSTYTMIFEPIPFTATQIDLYEGDSPRAFAIGGISVEKGASPTQLKEIPLPDRKAPAPVFSEEIAQSKIILKIGNYNPRFVSEKIQLALYRPVVGLEQLSADLDSEGRAEFDVLLRGSSKFFLFDMNSSMILASGFVKPGETVEAFCDLSGLGKLAMSARPDGVEKYDSRVLDGYKGFYRGVKQANSNLPRLDVFNASFVTEFPVSADDFCDSLLKRYDEIESAINDSPESEADKKVAMWTLKDEALIAFINSKSIVSTAYSIQQGAECDEAELPVMGKEQADRFFARVSYEEPELMMMSYNYFSAARAVEQGYVQCGLLYEVGRGNILAKAAQNANLSENDKKEIASFQNKFIEKTILDIHREAQELLGRKAPYNTPSEWKGAKAWFESILAPHKGKVVMVDLWNVWCGPCRAAISHNEPLKKTTLSSDQIDWIYIADQSSTVSTYRNMVGDIRGEHWFLSEDQAEELRDLFGVDGIPFYVLVEKDGSWTPRPDLRDHDLFTKELLDRVK